MLIMNKVNEIMLFIIILFLLLGDVLLFGHILNELFNWDPTIIAGSIGFIGAILGGAITYYGVNKTLKHRDRELFLETATEKLLALENLIDQHSEYLNRAFFYENSFSDKESRKHIIKQLLGEFLESLQRNVNQINKNMTYDEITIIRFHKKSITALYNKKSFSIEDSDKSVEKIREVFKVLTVSKDRLQKKYYKYK